MGVAYEWVVEEIDPNDEYEDIQETSAWEKYIDALGSAEWVRREGLRADIVLVRDEGDDVDGLTDRSWAYLEKDGTLPTYFANSGGVDTTVKVPKRFHQEVARHKQLKKLP